MIIPERTSRLFYQGDLFALTSTRMAELNSRIGQYKNRSLEPYENEKLAKQITEEFNIHPIWLDKANIHQLEPEQCQIDRSGDRMAEFFWRDHFGNRPILASAVRYTFCVPFKGDERLFFHTPSRYSMSGYTGSIQRNILLISYVVFQEEPSGLSRRLKEQFNRDLAQIEDTLSASNSDISGFNREVETRVKGLLADLQQKRTTASCVAEEIGFPIKRRQGEMQHDEALISLPRSEAKFDLEEDPEPFLSERAYDQIISIIDKSGKSMERAARDFAEDNEEKLRHHILVTLNSGSQRGSAETFSRKGKTDIFIEKKNGAIFIAECKIWKGENHFLESVDQLLGYLTWRDTKAALIVFSKNKDFSKVLLAARSAVQSHTNFKGFVHMAKPHESIFKCELISSIDGVRKVVLCVLLFNIIA